MKLRRAELESMSTKELVQIGNDVYGVALDSRAGTEDLVAKLLEVADKEIGKKVFEPVASKAKRIRITLHSSQGPDGDKAQFVSVNGRAYQIPRDQVVEVPPEVLEVLNNAVQTVHELDGLREDGTARHRERNISRFAVSVHG